MTDRDSGRGGRPSLRLHELQAEKNALANAVARLVTEKEELRDVLFRYGDHTATCYAAKTTRCVCGWYFERKRLSIKPRTEDEQ